MLLGCNVYISEGRSLQILQKLKDVASAQQRAVFLQSFTDEPYNRTSFTLASRVPAQLASAVVNLAQEAFQLIDLHEQVASHPRVGIVDHISCHPFGPSTPLTEADSTAQLIGEQLGQALGVPVYLYGSAHPQSRPLPSLRRDLGYFAGSKTGHWSGWGSFAEGSLKLKPDFGPDAAKPTAGVTLIGSGLWVTNFNILLLTRELRRAQDISKQLSEKGGGLQGVQAMALPHQDGIEVACNLISSGQHQPCTEEVEARVLELATEQSIPVATAYRIGRPLQDLIEEASVQLPEES